MSVSAEAVLCIRNSDLSASLQATGFIPRQRVDTGSILLPNNLCFAPRHSVEERVDFRQIIPYIILAHKASVTLYKRAPTGSERRLHNCLSIGLGGHVRLSDAVFKCNRLDVQATLSRTAIRELREETGCSESEHAVREVIGVIYDDSDPVSRVHLGVVELWTFPSHPVVLAEESVIDCRAVPVEQLGAYMSRMENWSRLCSAFLMGAFQ